MRLDLTPQEIALFTLVAEEASRIDQEVYVVGGFVRDRILGRPTKDIDFVTVGDGPALAANVVKSGGRDASDLQIFKNFGTAMFRYQDLELEFVGARKESYEHHSRKPSVEQGTLLDDQLRRDFTINAMALRIQGKDKFTVIDPFNGLMDLSNKRIVTPQEPEKTFSDDPLRMMRAIRFATQLSFMIDDETMAAITAMAQRIEIVSMERVTTELNMIIRAEVPSRGFLLLDKTGLLAKIFPEFVALKGVEQMQGYGHKDNFYHTLQVLDNTAAVSNNLWLRWAALLHDIAKPVTKKFEQGHGWTFHGHEHVGAGMVPKIFRRLKLPMDEKMSYVKQLVRLHLRPIALVQEEITDSAVRRLLFEAGDDIEDLMVLCRADITSKNQDKVKKYLENYKMVMARLEEVEAKDHLRNWQPPISGAVIMDTFGIKPGPAVGQIKTAIREAILDGHLNNEYQEAYDFMVEEGRKLGLSPLKG